MLLRAGFELRKGWRVGKRSGVGPPLEHFFSRMPASLVALEAGIHSPWIGRLWRSWVMKVS